MPTTLVKPYTTLQEVQRETKNSAPELDDWYKQCINLASRYIEEKCKRDFWFHDYSDTEYEVDRRRVLSDKVVLPFPIITLTQLRVYSDFEDSNNDNDIWERDEYYFIVGESFIEAEAENDWKMRFGDPVFGGYPFKGFLKVMGTFGYPLEAGEAGLQLPPPTMPSEVRRACTIIASALSAENHKEQVGLDGTRVELLETAIPSEAKSMLHRWEDKFLTHF